MKSWKEFGFYTITLQRDKSIELLKKKPLFLFLFRSGRWNNRRHLGPNEKRENEIFGTVPRASTSASMMRQSTAQIRSFYVIANDLPSIINTRHLFYFCFEERLFTFPVRIRLLSISDSQRYYEITNLWESWDKYYAAPTFRTQFFWEKKHSELILGFHRGVPILSDL